MKGRHGMKRKDFTLFPEVCIPDAFSSRNQQGDGVRGIKGNLTYPRNEC
jgi:hypothetical protein